MAVFEGILYADGRPALPCTPRLILSLYFDYRHFFLGVGRRKHTAKIHRQLADILADTLAADALQPLVAELLPVEEMVMEPHRLWAFCRFAAELSMIELARQLDGSLRDRFDQDLLREALSLSNTYEAECILYEIELGLSEKDFLDAVLDRKDVSIARWVRLNEDGTRSYAGGDDEVSIHLKRRGRYGRFTMPLNKDGSKAALPEAVLKVIREDATFKERRLAFITDRLQAHLLGRIMCSQPFSFPGALGHDTSPFVPYILVGSLLLYQKGGGVFLYTTDGPISASGDPYAILPGTPICLAREAVIDPGEMKQWIAYFRRHHLEPLIWQFGPM